MPSNFAVGAVSLEPDRLDVFGVSDNGAMYHKWWEGSEWWPDWEPVPAASSRTGNAVFFTSPPVALAQPKFGGQGGEASPIEVFAVGDTAEMYNNWWGKPPVSWQPQWLQLEGLFTSLPAAVSYPDVLGAGRIDVFGVGDNSAMYHNAWVPPNVWSGQGWESLGGSFQSPPAAVAWGPNRVDVFGVGDNAEMYHNSWEDSRGGSKWQANWDSLGGSFQSPPAAVSWGPDRLDVFGVGDNAEMYHNSWDGSKWQAKWDSLGGSFHIPPVQ